jgi:hypothetical protein
MALATSDFAVAAFELFFLRAAWQDSCEDIPFAALLADSETSVSASLTEATRA